MRSREYPGAVTVAGLVQPEGMKMQSGIYHKFIFLFYLLFFCLSYFNLLLSSASSNIMVKVVIDVTYTIDVDVEI